MRGNVLGHIEPVSTNIRQTVRRAVGRHLHAPVPVGVAEQPVPGIGPLYHQDLAQLADLTQAAQVLHHGIVAQVVAHAVVPLRAASDGDQLACLLHRDGQWLLAQHVFAGFESVSGHREVQRVRGADMHRIHPGILENALVVRLHALHRELRCEFPSLVQVRVYDRDNLGGPHMAKGLEVETSHESDAHDGDSRFRHFKVLRRMCGAVGVERPG